MGAHILVVDDDVQLTTFLERYLRKQGYEVTCVATARGMTEVLARQPIDLCVLDIGLPDRDGFEVMQELRRDSPLPVVVLSARDEVFDRVVGLELGADDYVTKPFEPRELLARVKTVLRRTRQEPPKEAVDQVAKDSLHFGSWSLELAARRLIDRLSGEAVRLTSTEFSLLKALVDHPNTVLSRDRLLDLIHGAGAYVTDRTIDVHIARLRRKIEKDPAEPALVKTVHGAGYVFASRVARA